MKSPTANSFLLLLNLGLIATVGYLIKTRSRPALPPVQAATRIVTNAPKVVIKGSAPRIVTVTNDFRWAQLETENYRDYIARLRSIGCPEQTIRDIIIADLDKLFAPQVQSMYGRRPNLHYWDSEEEELANDQDHRKWVQQEQAVNEEKRAIIMELLGVDLVRERLKVKGDQDYYERRLGFLPDNKETAVRLLLEKYDGLEAPLRGVLDEPGQSLTATEREELVQLRSTKQAELAQVLSPAEQQEFELWMSPTANAVRYAFYGMNATEQEFLEVYELRKAFDEEYPPEILDMNDPVQVENWAQAKQALDQQLKQTLGESRYQEYQRGEDPDWHQLNATVTRFELPREKAAEVYAMKQTLRDTRRYVENDPRLSFEQKTTALQEISQETQHAIQEILGSEAGPYFLQKTGGEWER